MATKKAKSTSAKPGKADIKVLRSELASGESKRDKWKKRAVRAEAVTADLRARLTVAEKDLKNERKAAVTAAAVSPRKVSAPSTGVAAPSAGQMSSTAGVPDATSPDGTWTVAELRAEARRRGDRRNVEEAEGGPARRLGVSDASDGSL